jgi:hypothetical protein
MCGSGVRSLHPGCPMWWQAPLLNGVRAHPVAAAWGASSSVAPDYTDMYVGPTPGEWFHP